MELRATPIHGEDELQLSFIISNGSGLYRYLARSKRQDSNVGSAMTSSAMRMVKAKITGTHRFRGVRGLIAPPCRPQVQADYSNVEDGAPRLTMRRLRS